MPKRICLINGHPDPSPERFCHALTDTYQAGAQETGHNVDRLDVGAMEFSFLSSPQEFETKPPAVFDPVRTAMSEADHLVLIYQPMAVSVPFQRHREKSDRPQGAAAGAPLPDRAKQRTPR